MKNPMAPKSNRKPANARGDRLKGWPRPQTNITRAAGLNPVRMALLIVLALGGVFGGYYIGKYINPAPTAPDKPAPESAVDPEQAAPPPSSIDYASHTHEEPLPRNIVVQQDGILQRIALPAPEIEIDFSALAPSQPSDPPSGVAPEADAPATDSGPAEPRAPAPAPPIQLTRAMPDGLADMQRLNRDALPPWQRYALPVDLDERPKIVIVIDDVGLDRRRARRTWSLPGPLTLSFMAYSEGLATQTEAAKDAGHELMLHIPMEPTSASINPGPNVLLSGMPGDELRKNVIWNLDQVDGYVGINNHMGSRFTSDRAGMDVVVAELRKRGLLFLDSVTSSRSVAHSAARAGGIPYAVRNIFLDHDDDLAAINRQLARLERLAKKSGVGIAIGHPRDKTLEALADWLPTLDDRGFQLVPISAVAQIASAE